MTVIEWTSARSEHTMDGVSFILDRKRVIFIAACETSREKLRMQDV